jgi:PleD family two-component response regulator
LADTSLTGSAKVVERIRAYLLEWNQERNLRGFELSLSIGVAEWSEGTTIDELLDDADREMYAAKADHLLSKGKPNLAKAAEPTVGL